MSKHEKQARRARRKAEQQRWSSAATHGTAALAAAAAIAAGTSAYAAPVRFDNPAGPGHFDWAAANFSEAKWLDVTLDADSQPGGVGPGTHNASSFWHHPDSYGVIANGGAALPQVLRDGYALVGLNAGDLVTPTGSQYWLAYGFVDYNSYGPLLPEGTPIYVGVRFDLGTGAQYGWIGVTRNGYTLDAFAWGYETEPGVAIPAGAPEPGSLALLAMGAVGVLSRRRA